MTPDIYTYIKEQESAFDTQEIRVGDNWNWNFKNHVQMIFHLKNSKFYSGENDYLRAFNNIMEPILNLAYWTEDIEVKDILFYIEQKGGRVLSFLVKKYHDEIYVKKNNIDTLVDDITEEDVDYGGVLVQKGETSPEVIPLQAIAFCDQTDLMGGAVAFKANYNPSSIRKMAKNGWGDKKNGATITLDELILQAEPVKDATNGIKNETTSKNIEVYILRGSFPEHYLEDNDNMEDYSDQLHIVGFYTAKDKKEGVTLFRSKETDAIKFHTSKKVYGKALGKGVGESLLQPQIWTNFLEIHKMAMLEGGAKNVLYTDDDSYTDRNKIIDMETNEVTVIEEGKRIQRVPTDNPMAVQLFEKSVDSWYENAQALGSAFDPIMGKQATSGTTFRGQERTVHQGGGSHNKRRGQRAKFIEELYRWDIIPRIKKEILKGTKFLATLTTEELKWVSESMVENEVQKQLNEMVLSGKPIPEGTKELLTSEAQERFRKVGNKWPIDIIKGEFKDVEIKMGISISGKQKNLGAMSDKVLAIFQTAMANPVAFQQSLQNPALARAFNSILEFSGIPEVDFSDMMEAQAKQLDQPVDVSGLKPKTEEVTKV